MNILQELTGLSSTDFYPQIPSSRETQNIDDLPWKNPGQVDPKELYNKGSVDQARAMLDIEMCWVLSGKLGQPSLRILDIGCVTGHSTTMIGMKVHPTSFVLGVDIERNVEFARQHNRFQNIDYEPITSPLCLPAFYKKKWSLISAFAFFSWIPKDRQVEVLKAIYGVLNDRGEFLFRLEMIGERPYRQAADEVAHQDPRWNKCFEHYVAPFVDQTVEGFKTNLTEAGFELTYSSSPEESLSQTIFPTKETLKAYLSCWLPHLSQLRLSHPDDPKICDLFCEQVVERYCQLIGSDGTNISLHLPGFLGTAKKILSQEPIGGIKV